MDFLIKANERLLHNIRMEQGILRGYRVALKDPAATVSIDQTLQGLDDLAQKIEATVTQLKAGDPS
jgi:hypothetical protein